MEPKLEMFSHQFVTANAQVSLPGGIPFLDSSFMENCGWGQLQIALRILAIQ
ncbi:hypothetical protein [Paraburkholderia ginsengisoli]|uniref:Uncharacterized protein n=1 Tax=Paraburkholderia ginsengisoli TaxID=311231 RepID=A0A7T4N0S2_9BURK|nr:hypothetical protein [Paraburkholderia ginsengisoli]QQC63162.1 hypothetical protein I6I06_12695 [Paraburkholderia ginsengisoli]